jgi:hypothetical protein
MRVTRTELLRLGVRVEVGQEFETNLLEVRRARFRVEKISLRMVDITRLDWLEEPTPRPVRQSNPARHASG